MRKNVSTKEQLRAQIAGLVQQYADLACAPITFVPGKVAVPSAGKVIGAKELQNMVEASLDGWLTTGRFNDAFEKRLKKFLGVKHAITTNSGSSANLLAFQARYQTTAMPFRWTFTRADLQRLLARLADTATEQPAA